MMSALTQEIEAARVEDAFLIRRMAYELAVSSAHARGGRDAHTESLLASAKAIEAYLRGEQP